VAPLGEEGGRGKESGSWSRPTEVLEWEGGGRGVESCCCSRTKREVALRGIHFGGEAKVKTFSIGSSRVHEADAIRHHLSSAPFLFSSRPPRLLKSNQGLRGVSVRPLGSVAWGEGARGKAVEEAAALWLLFSSCVAVVLCERRRRRDVLVMFARSSVSLHPNLAFLDRPFFPIQEAQPEIKRSRSRDQEIRRSGDQEIKRSREEEKKRRREEEKKRRGKAVCL